MLLHGAPIGPRFRAPLSSVVLVFFFLLSQLLHLWPWTFPALVIIFLQQASAALHAARSRPAITLLHHAASGLATSFVRDMLSTLRAARALQKFESFPWSAQRSSWDIVSPEPSSHRYISPRGCAVSSRQTRPFSKFLLGASATATADAEHDVSRAWVTQASASERRIVLSMSLISWCTEKHNTTEAPSCSIYLTRRNQYKNRPASWIFQIVMACHPISTRSPSQP